MKRFITWAVFSALLLSLLHMWEMHVRQNCFDYLNENPSESYRLKCDKIGQP